MLFYIYFQRSETGMNLQKVKVVTQKLDPSMFKPAKKSRFDQMPMSGGTGANATPLGKEPTIVLNKHVISRFTEYLVYFYVEFCIIMSRAYNFNNDLSKVICVINSLNN